MQRKGTFASLPETRKSFQIKKSSSCAKGGIRADQYSWDVPKLHESHQATWPEHTEKCLLDEAGKCGISDLEYAFSEWGFEEYVNMPEWMFHVREAEYAAYDFITNRTGTFAAANRHSLGWETRLELDEFPLEIQCQPCFW